jgi:CheY-like chemotaxis protein
MAILVVDDDQTVRDFIADYLEQSGFAVVKAEDGLRAIQRLKGNPEISLLLSDLCMPTMNGVELAKACHQLRPHLPIILVSGYHENFDLSQVKPFVHALVNKPFDLDTIVETIAGAIKTVEIRPVFLRRNS